jgi:hypothetical protein
LKLNSNIQISEVLFGDRKTEKGTEIRKKCRETEEQKDRKNTETDMDRSRERQ